MPRTPASQMRKLVFQNQSMQQRPMAMASQAAPPLMPA
jgi:hypothetical protein